MEEFLKKLYLPKEDSHKGQNGRLLIIGGSHLFHSASLWALKVASRIVDLVHYSSVQENNKIVQDLKEEFRDGIVVPRTEIENYIEEDDCVLIGPGMVRTENSTLNQSKHGSGLPRTELRSGTGAKLKTQISNLKDLESIEDEGVQTYLLTKYLLKKYPQKKWVIDAGALQMMEPEWIPEGAILTPHKREFVSLYLKSQISNLKTTTQISNLEEETKIFAKKFNCTVL